MVWNSSSTPAKTNGLFPIDLESANVMWYQKATRARYTMRIKGSYNNKNKNDH